MDLTGADVAIVGLGRSGRAAAALCRRFGAARLVGVDAKVCTPIEGLTQVGGDWERTLTSADVVVVSPGVPAAHPAVAAAQRAGRVVIGELGLAASLLDVPMVGITGTNGKSTVTAFTGTLLRHAGLHAFVGGNLGDPLSDAVDGSTWDVLVVEISSYQLELAGALRPRAAAILNLTPDHLARHGDMDGYADAKARLLDHQQPGDVAFVQMTNPWLARATEGRGHGRHLALGGQPGVSREGTTAIVDLGDGPVQVDLSAVSVPGAHNLDHAATAAALALAVGVDPEALAPGLAALEALPHRMQPVSERGGCLWIDDSKATNVEATAVAVAGIDRPSVVLLGGQAKGPGFDALLDPLGRHRAAVCFGASGPDIAAELSGATVPVTRVGSMEEAVAVAEQLAHPGDAILLSPGCASFDAYTDFTHRGRVFAALARGRTP